jgi:hypothetical protein
MLSSSVTAWSLTVITPPAAALGTLPARGSPRGAKITRDVDGRPVVRQAPFLTFPGPVLKPGRGWGGSPLTLVMISAAMSRSLRLRFWDV